MRKINIPLVLGCIIVLLLILMSFYPEYFSKTDPYSKEPLQYTYENGKSTIIIPPIAPNDIYPFGTDRKGRDLKSLIAYGCKYTMVSAITIVLGRMIIALPIAIFAAYKNKTARWIIKVFSVLFSAFPLVLAVLMLREIKIMADLFVSVSNATTFLLIILGWSKIARSIENEVERVLDEDFIEGEIAIGKNKFEIAVENIVPHIIPQVFVLLFLEVSIVLLIMCQIGVLNIVATGGFYNADGALMAPVEFDWASLLTTASLYFGTDKAWIIIYPSIAFSIAIIGFNLLGEGLRMEFENKSSKVITGIRKVPILLSPVRLIYEMKNMDKHRHTVYKKLGAIIIIIIILFLPSPKSVYGFDKLNAYHTIEELSSSKYMGRKAGSHGNLLVASYLENKLKEYHIEPYNDKYIHEFDIDQSVSIKSSKMKVFKDDSRSIEFSYRDDYFISSHIPYSGTYDLKVFDYFEYKALMTYDDEPRAVGEMKNSYKGKVLVFDIRRFNPIDLTRILSYIERILQPKGIVLIEGWTSGERDKKLEFISNLKDSTMTIHISSNKGDELLRFGEGKLEIDIDINNYENVRGANIIGCIPGQDESLKNEVVIIGSSIDSVGDYLNIKYPSSASAAAVAIELEIARIMANNGLKPKRTIIFAFWDGSYINDRGSRLFANKLSSDEENTFFYIDLQSFGNKNFDKLVFDTSGVSPNNKVAQEHIKALKDNAKKYGVKYMHAAIYIPQRTDFIGQNKEMIIIDSNHSEKVFMTEADNVSNIDKNKLELIGQILADTICEAALGE